MHGQASKIIGGNAQESINLQAPAARGLSVCGRPTEELRPFLESKNRNQASVPVERRELHDAAGILGERLSRLSLVRVGVRNASGMGDQVAALSIIENLKRFGFNGQIQLVFRADAGDESSLIGLRKKLAFLIPEFIADDDKPQCVEIKGLKCVCIPVEQLGDYCEQTDCSLHQPLALWPMNCNRNILKCDYGVVIPPFAWTMHKSRIERPESMNELINFPPLANYQPDCTGCFQDFQPNVCNEPKTKILLDILECVGKGGVHLLPVYGIHHEKIEPSHDVVIRRLLNAVDKSHVADVEKTIVVIFSPLESPERIRRLAGTLQKPFYDINKEDERAGVSKAINENSLESIVLIYSGAVSRMLFEHFCRMVDRPLIQEGANTASFMHQIGKPYLPLLPKGNTGLPKIPEGGNIEYRHKFKQPEMDDLRRSIENVALSLTSNVRLCGYFCTAVSIWDQWRAFLPEYGLRNLEKYFVNYLRDNSFLEMVFITELWEMIKYGCEPLPEVSRIWLAGLCDLIKMKNAGSSVSEIKKAARPLVKQLDKLKKGKINLEALIRYRTVGVPVVWLRRHIQELSLKHDLEVSSRSLICPLPEREIPPDKEITELINDTCDNFEMFLPALNNLLYQHDQSNLQQELLFNEKSKDDFLDNIKSCLFHGDESNKSSILNQLTASHVDNAPLASFIRGDWGRDYFERLQYHVLRPENNAVRIALRALSEDDWSNILKHADNGKGKV